MKQLYYLLNILVFPINLFFKIIFQKKYQKPIIMVIGNHASGGTLIYQILSSCYKLNYINNISGKFYKNFFIIQIINILTDALFKNYTSNLKSINGITKGIVEPNEFGWFWKDIFKKNSGANV